jgi:hypothetical protein
MARDTSCQRSLLRVQNGTSSLRLRVVMPDLPMAVLRVSGRGRADAEFATTGASAAVAGTLP